MESKRISRSADFADILQTATQQVFSTMLGMELEKGILSLRTHR